MTSDVPPDSIRVVEAEDGSRIAIYNVEGQFYATAALCTHADACLSEGMVLGHEVICPMHGGAFDIRTGQPTAAPCVIPLKTYSVALENDGIYVQDGSD